MKSRSVIAIIAGFVLVWAVVAAALLGGIAAWQPDIGLYHYVSQMFLRGALPYRDFPLEYPPLALLPFVLAALPVGGSGVSPDAYVWGLLATNALYAALIGLLVVRVATRWLPDRNPMWRGVVYGVCLLLGAGLYPWRFDLFPALLTIGAAALVLEKRPLAAGVCVGLAIATKLYPLVLVPVFAVWYLARGDRKGAALLCGAATGVPVLLAIPFLVLAPAELLDFVRYHQHRGIQLESVAAGLLMLAHLKGTISLGVIQNFGAIHVVSLAADAVQPWLLPTFVVVMAGVTVAAYRQFTRARTIGAVAVAPALPRLALAALLGFVITNKVFSAQFAIWFLPFIPLLTKRQAALGVAIIFLTAAIYPFAHVALVELHPGAVLLLNARNFCAVGLFAWLLRDAVIHRPEGAAKG